MRVTKYESKKQQLQNEADNKANERDGATPIAIDTIPKDSQVGTVRKSKFNQSNQLVRMARPE